MQRTRLGRRGGGWGGEGLGRTRSRLNRSRACLPPAAASVAIVTVLALCLPAPSARAETSAELLAKLDGFSRERGLFPTAVFWARRQHLWDGQESGSRAEDAKAEELGVVPSARGLRASRREARLTVPAAPEDAARIIVEARCVGREITTSNNRTEREPPGG